MYEIMICPIKRLYGLAQDGDMSDVSVLAVSSYPIETDRLDGFHSALCLSFDDITLSESPSALTYETAMNIARYVKNLPPRLDTLFCCCDSGELRSSAMAAAILRYNGGDEMKIWRNPRYHPNPLVYKLLCKALSVPVTDGEADARLEINEITLANAIKKN